MWQGLYRKSYARCSLSKTIAIGSGMMRCWLGLFLWTWVGATATVAQESPPAPTPLVVVCCQGELDRAERLRQAAEQGAPIDSLRDLARQEGFELVEHQSDHYALSRTLLTFPATIDANLLECLMRQSDSLSQADCDSAKRFVVQSLQLMASIPEFVQTVASKVGLSLAEWMEQAQWEIQLSAGQLTASRDGNAAIFVGECEYLPSALPHQESPRASRSDDNMSKDMVPVATCSDYHFLYTSAVPLSLRRERVRDALELIARRETQEQQRLNQLIAQLQSRYRAELAGRTLKFAELPSDIQQRIVESRVGFEEDTSSLSEAMQGTYTLYVTPEVTIRFTHGGKSWLVHVYLIPNMPADVRPVAVGLLSE